MGPLIVTLDFIEKPVYNLMIIRRIKGRDECESSTSYMRFRFDDIISFVTAFMTLNSGDIVTSAGRSTGSTEFGDMIEAAVERIGVLENHIIGSDVDLRCARDVGLVSS